MKITKIISQHRRDLMLELTCEHCGHTITEPGYDDEHFHTNVVPGMPCEECGKTAPEGFEPMSPRYASWEVV